MKVGLSDLDICDSLNISRPGSGPRGNHPANNESFPWSGVEAEV